MVYLTHTHTLSLSGVLRCVQALKRTVGILCVSVRVIFNHASKCKAMRDCRLTRQGRWCERGQKAPWNKGELCRTGTNEWPLNWQVVTALLLPVLLGLSRPWIRFHEWQICFSKISQLLLHVSGRSQEWTHARDDKKWKWGTLDVHVGMRKWLIKSPATVLKWLVII